MKAGKFVTIKSEQFIGLQFVSIISFCQRQIEDCSKSFVKRRIIILLIYAKHMVKAFEISIENTISLAIFSKIGSSRNIFGTERTWVRPRTKSL